METCGFDLVGKFELRFGEVFPCIILHAVARFAPLYAPYC